MLEIGAIEQNFNLDKALYLFYGVNLGLKNEIKQKIKTSYKNYGTPIGISTYYYEKEVEEIAKMIVERAAEYGYEFNDVF